MSSSRVLALCALLGALISVSSAAAQSPLLNSEEEQDTSLPFRGSTFSVGQTLSANAFTRQLSYNPQYVWGFSLALRWYLNQKYSLGLNQGLQIELTDSDTTIRRQEPLLSDTNAQFDARLFEWRFAERHHVGMHGQAVVLAPTSIASRAATMILGTQLNLAPIVTFDDWLEGVGMGLEISYLHRFLESNTLQSSTGYPCYTGGTSWTQCNSLGYANVRDAFSLAVLADVNVTTRFALHFVGEFSWYHANSFPAATINPLSGGSFVVGDTSNTHWRDTRYLELGASYSFFAWMSLGLAVTNLFAERSYTGNPRAPFIAADTLFGLRALVSLDELYLAFTGVRTGTAAPIPKK